MVHALHEAHRVLKPTGLLLDLRPAAAHRQVGVGQLGQYRLLGIMRESIADDYQANRAVATVVRQGLFRPAGRERFDCNRTMDTLAEFRAWLDEFVSGGRLPSHSWLAQRVERAFRLGPAKLKIIVRGPLDLRVLRKGAAAVREVGVAKR